MGWDSFGMVRLRIAKLKIAYNSIIIGPTSLGWLNNLQEIMGCEFFGVVRFDLGPLLQGQTRIAKLKSALSLNHFITALLREVKAKQTLCRGLHMNGSGGGGGQEHLFHVHTGDAQ